MAQKNGVTALNWLRVVLLIWLLAASLAIGTLAIGLYTGFAARDSALEAIVCVALLVFPVCGGLIALHRPANPEGWLFCAIGFVWLTMFFCDAYAALTLVLEPGILPGGRVAVWVYEWIWLLAIGMPLVYPLLLFPDGRLLSPHWRVVAWTAGIALGVGLFFSMFAPRLLGEELARNNPGMGLIQNPFGVGLPYLWEIGEVVVALCLLVLVACAMAAAWSLRLRFQRSSGIERQQLKWFVYAASLLAFAFLISVIGFAMADEDIAGVRVSAEAVEAVSGLTLLALFGLPVAAALAILRYRLYDIDRIINKTLTYTLLTAGLGATYFGLVVGLQALLRPVGGGSDLAIVATTLVVAALSLPARRRVQRVVDRRFNRRAYDVERTIEAFSARLREQIDLDTLRYELLAVVDETMQPASASLWLRDRGAAP
jgi:uncharacterized membrane protein YidH (DUF202 family)